VTQWAGKADAVNPNRQDTVKKRGARGLSEALYRRMGTLLISALKYTSMERRRASMEKTRRRNSPKILYTGLLSSIAVCVALILGTGNAVHAAPVVNHPSGARSNAYARPDIPVPQIKERIGVFVGEADSHTVAINTAGLEWCYQIWERDQVSFSGIASGDKVWIEYKEIKYADGVTQLFLTKIKKIFDVKTAKGIANNIPRE
jgi:hypothetical protein